MTFALTEAEQRAKARVCLPLDNIETLQALQNKVRELEPVVGLFKIGKGSYTRFGPQAIEVVHESGGKVFLDLKYHDIPNTVEDAARAAAQHGVYMFNVHASGGSEMMRAAVSGANEGAAKYGFAVPKVIGVTVLTSIDEERMNTELRVPGSIDEQVLHLGELAWRSALDGIVCSPVDLEGIVKFLPANFMYVTPGIKGVDTESGADQKRVDTPGNAVRNGSSILVIGRAITAPKTRELRLEAGYKILQDMAKYI